MLARIGIVPGRSCCCHATAVKMDREGGAWCLENIEGIVSVMRAEAERRKLPFIATVARMMVKRAVRLAAENNKP